MYFGLMAVVALLSLIGLIEFFYMILIGSKSDYVS